MDEKVYIGKRISELRRKQGLSQEQVAGRADINPNYLSRIERGKENPTLDMLIKLAHALGTEMWEMFDFSHIGNRKDLQKTIQNLAQSADETSLRLALKVFRAITR
ncbi:MAG: helix-turn-helix transcriptional regulator [Nitrospiraceae bacterium]|nr:helix-turn-helix transcriptional regulator [Nitrospiraceae bacterium]